MIGIVVGEERDHLVVRSAECQLAGGRLAGHRRWRGLHARQRRSAGQPERVLRHQQSIERDSPQAAFCGNRGATGGPENLAKQNFYVGINDSLGGDPGGDTFSAHVFSDYDAWADLNGSPYRQSIARGEDLFNNLPLSITGVGGLNDALGQQVIMGTCTTCHDSPNAGNHSFSVPLAIGTTAYPALPQLDVSGLPVYTVQCIATGATVQVTDLGRAMISGKCADIGKLKGPVLRGLAARAPYFHNGSAATLADVVSFYDVRFHLNLSEQEKADLVAFLRSL